MALVEESLISWLSGCSSSLQIIIVSAFFIIIYVTLYSLCTNCFSFSHSSQSQRNSHRQEKRNIPSESPEHKLPESQRPDYSATVDLEDEVTVENPYECISEPASDRAEWESESPSAAVTPPDDELSVSVNTPHTSPHAQNNQTNPEETAVYAAVNWKTKSHKNIKPLLDTEIDMSEFNKEAVPPIPDKHF